jgi:2-polyprenyl-6-hydroxyphenyl methylase/3-demethylubiquinone-9 3-methyltransferase
MTGMTYNPLLKTYKLNPRDVDVNYLLQAFKPES